METFFAYEPGRDPGSAREPDVGECRYCGSSPAVKTTQQALGSIAVFYRITTWQGEMCRACARAVHADATARTMTWVWWGVAGFMFWFFPLINRRRLRRALELDLPRPTPGVVAPLAAPRAEALPWTKRRGAVVATCVGGGLWFLIAAILVAGFSK